LLVFILLRPEGALFSALATPGPFFYPCSLSREEAEPYCSPAGCPVRGFPLTVSKNVWPGLPCWHLLILPPKAGLGLAQESGAIMPPTEPDLWSQGDSPSVYCSA
jgi:hypothetical protein